MQSKKSIGIIFLLLFTLVLSAGCTSLAEQKSTSAVEAIVQTMHAFESRTPYPTATAYATQTPYPSATPYPTLSQEDLELLPVAAPLASIARYTPEPRENTILMLKGVWSRDMSQYVRCGKWFEVRLGYKQPYFAYAVGNEVSKNQFLIVNVFIRNTSSRTIPLIFHKQFKMIGFNNGNPEVFDSYGPAGLSACSRWGKPFVSSQGIPPGIEMETYLGFDVNYHDEGWTLAFDSDASGEFTCQFALEIPQPDFPIRYYETMESANRL